ncbi:MAG TPA: hypothetical protein DHV59_00785 [Oxalobacteraceae bacterium]|nr:hypothetical protein [Oxalobacteraceae bacterium]
MLEHLPGQYSSGGKARLGKIAKAGDRYLQVKTVYLHTRLLSGSGRPITNPLNKTFCSIADRPCRRSSTLEYICKNKPKNLLENLGKLFTSS